MRRLTALVVLAALVTACSNGGGSSAPPSTTTTQPRCTVETQKDLERIDVTVGGQARTALVHLPTGWDVPPSAITGHGCPNVEIAEQLENSLKNFANLPKNTQRESRPGGCMAREAQKHESAIEVLCRQRAPHLEREARDAYGEQLRRRRARVPANPDTAFAGPGTSPPVAGTEDPRELARTMPLVERAFGFVDLCGFTHFMDRHGEHAAIEALTTFRSLTREIATRRGIIVDKWLGDGAMLVGVSVGPIIAAGTELIGRYPGDPLHLRGGIAHGWVLILDGDDYIGRPANLAARLCQSARPGELLAVGYPAASLPPWTRVRGTRDLTLRGLGRFRRIQQLELADNLELPPLRCVDGHPHRHGAWATSPGEA